MDNLWKPTKQDLWKPTKQDRASLNRGTQKIRVHNLKADKRIEDWICPYCEAPVYKFTKGQKMLTLNGSEHKCKGMPKARI